MEAFRKAYWALKDSTKVGLARVNSEFKDLDIAIVKATNHVERPPKERYVRKIFVAVSISRPRADVAYCIHVLSKRLAKTHSWIVAIKTLIVIHRTLREADPSFREELLHYSQRGHLFQISSFKDDSSPLAWDCSAWIRTYGLFLEERLECFRTLNYDIELERVPKRLAVGESKACCKTRVSNVEQLLRKLPALQQLLYRLVGCQPEQAASHNFLIQYALALVLKESFKIYCAINDGIINLIDTFFEMTKHDAVRVFDIYRKSGQQAELLADFYRFCKTLDLARTFQFPALRKPPPSFLATMEEYVKEASQTGSVSSTKRMEYREAERVQQKSEYPASDAIEKQVEEKTNKIDSQEKPDQFMNGKEILPLVSVEDPANVFKVNLKALQLEENNALALAIIQPGDYPPAATNNTLSEIGKTSGWELALVTAPSIMNKTQVTETKMAGGFDKLLLDSLYEDDAARRRIQLHSAGYNMCHGYEVTPQNLFIQHDPFAMSDNIVPPRNMQMAMTSQQMMFHQQQHSTMMMVPHNPYTGQYYQQQMRNSNPFGDPFYYSHNANGNHTLL